MSLAGIGCLLATSCGSGGGFPDAPPPDVAIPGGTVSLEWALTDLQGRPITCDEIGAQTVTLIVHNVEASGASPEVFSCNSMSGTTPKLEPGRYEVDFELNGTSGLIAQAPKQMNVMIASNENTPLMPIAFAVQAAGNLDVKISAVGGNCKAVGMGGAGITGMSITLTHDDNDVCEPITFDISGMPARTYTVNCQTPTVVPCIDETKSLTAMNVPSDGYHVHIRGHKNNDNAVVCFTNDDAITVPPLGKTLMRTFNLLYLSQTPGC